MFAGAIALFVSFVSLVLFLIHIVKKPEAVISKGEVAVILGLIILNGTIIRLTLASVCYGNYDMQCHEIFADIAIRGGNVFTETAKYRHTPAWFMITGVLKRIQLQFPALPFHFVVRSFLTGVDLLTLLFVILIARYKKISVIKTSLFFYLNPMIFLITGYHGQFENLAILMVLIGIYVYLKCKNKPVFAVAFLWIFASAGMIIKHNIFYELIICLNIAIKRYWLKVLLFVLSVSAFLAMFIPYWSTGRESIIENVFRYSSGVGFYGILSLIDLPWLKYVFVVGLCVFPLFLKNKDIVWQCLMGMLFFVTFTTGMAVQYLVLPIALGALRPSKGFLLYSLAGALFILGHGSNVCLPVFSGLLKWNALWVAATGWFIVELYNSKKAELPDGPSRLVGTKNDKF